MPEAGAGGRNWPGRSGLTRSTAALRVLFEGIAGRYDRHAAFEREVAARLLERTVFQRHPPSRIIDLGCGTGHCAAALQQRFPQASVIGLDFAVAMCRHASQRLTRRAGVGVVAAALGSLPFAARSADLLVANLALQWEVDFVKIFSELRRVIRPGGLLLFSSPGPASLYELRRACGAGGLVVRVAPFVDMHDLGDALVAAGFDEPVVDTDSLVLHYPSLVALLDELESTGACSHVDDWLMLRDAEAVLARAWPRLAGPHPWPLSWEVVCGAAFGPADGRPVRSDSGEIATFDVAALRRTLPGSGRA